MRRLVPKQLWLVNLLMMPAALIALNACSTPAEPTRGTGGSTSTGSGGSVSATTGGSGQLGTGGLTSTPTGGTGSSTTGGTGSSTTGGTGSSTTGGTGSGITGGAGTATTGGATSGTSGGAGTATSGGTDGGSSGGTAAVGGSGGAGPKVKLCATKTTITLPLMTNFDSYDGKLAADAWSFPFNGAATDPSVPYAGPYTYDDRTGTPIMGMVGGANSSAYAIGISNPMASGWGGALAFWMGCANASSFTGLSFSARGTLPTGNINVSLTMEQSTAPDAVDPKGGGTCDAGTLCKAPTAEVPVTAEWSLVQVPWTLFGPGLGSAMAAVPANGDNIAGIAFSVGLVYTESPPESGTYVPTPAAYSLEIDDLGFY